MIAHELGAPTPAGQSGVYTDTVNVTFDNFIAHDINVRDPMSPRVGGSADTSLVSGKLQVAADPVAHRGGMAVVEGFSDDYYVVEADLQAHSGRKICVRYRDPQNAICVEEPGNDSIEIRRYLNGQVSVLEAGDDSPGAVTVRVRVFDDSGTDTIKVYVDGVLKVTATDSQIPFGGVAFGGTGSGMLGFDNVRIGYDNNGDGDIDDAGDEIVRSETFGGTTCTVKHDDAGNLIDDCEFVYIYDAWNRLVKVRASNDSDVTIQTAEFDATGRRINKNVTNSGDLDAKTRYYYDGAKIIETRVGTETTMNQQVIRGRLHIDELVMVRVAEKGDLYVHQDANWNVIGLTDLAGSVVEAYTLSPYGELTVDQETGFGDYNGDGEVDATDRAVIDTGGVCLGGSPPPACRVMNLDFNTVYDSNDLTLFDALPQGNMIHPGRIATNVDQPFGHQGLLHDPEIRAIDNRARTLLPGARRFAQPDPLAFAGAEFVMADHYADGMNMYAYARANPVSFRDPSGTECKGSMVNVEMDWSKKWCVQSGQQCKSSQFGIWQACNDHVEFLDSWCESDDPEPSLFPCYFVDTPSNWTYKGLPDDPECVGGAYTVSCQRKFKGVMDSCCPGGQTQCDPQPKRFVKPKPDPTPDPPPTPDPS